MSELRRTLGPLALFSLGIGYVISGLYFGWNLGLPEGGPVGMLIATVLVSAMYVGFVLTYAELACALPKAGGAFVYASRAFGPTWGLVAGVGQWVELVLAPPAIAAAIGGFVNAIEPRLPPLAVAVFVYVLFTIVNWRGVALSAGLELVMTALAVAGLVVYGVIVVPRFSMARFLDDPLPHGAAGIMGAIPYAIWFYLGIEGLANVAEEARDPSRDLPRGFGGAMAVLVLLTLMVLFGSVGVAGWRGAVFRPGAAEPSDSPLPLVMAHVVGEGSVTFRVVVGVGLFGLLASFHGLLLAGARATFEFGRLGWGPAILGRVDARTGAPAPALATNLVLGLVALASGKTSDLITLSVFGALTMYGASVLAMLKLRRSEPGLARPFRTPLSPGLPIAAAVGIALSLVAMAISNRLLAAIFVGVIGLGYAWLFALVPRDRRS
jgi:ethanolamine permease